MEVKEKIDVLVESGQIEWKKHALQRMFERAISRAEVKKTIVNGEVIEVYEEDYPFPSFLIANINSEKPLHVVLSYDERMQMCYIITAYEPDTRYFLDDLMTRRENE